MTAGKEAFKPGEAKNSWLTGTAARNWYAITQFILGIRRDMTDSKLILAFLKNGTDMK